MATIKKAYDEVGQRSPIIPFHKYGLCLCHVHIGRGVAQLSPEEVMVHLANILARAHVANKTKTGMAKTCG